MEEAYTGNRNDLGAAKERNPFGLDYGNES
jgi:hypothetical protein